MGWIKDALAPLLGTVVGGVIALGATWLTNYGSAQKDFAAERRGKLEVLISDLFQEQACTLGSESGASVSEACAAGTAAYQSVVYSRLYFPELYKAVSEYQLAQFSLRLELQQCLGKAAGGDKLGVSTQRVTCLQQIANSRTQKHLQLDPIIDQARAVEQRITPKTWSISMFRDIF
ncbi:hypothetical protein PQQ72_08325 [Paraburkholderia strydomiana]|uniref:hypothetical protein n=1 Tax=Paraburkholderia strydomiana TaxID=1245417 RepID=UPI0038BCAE33